MNFKTQSCILLQKNTIFHKLGEIYQQFYKKFIDLKHILGYNTFNLELLQYLCVMSHFTFINYFDHDNTVIRNIVMSKSSLFNKAPNYFIPPLIQYDLFYGKYTGTEKHKLQNNLNTFVELMVLEQFEQIKQGKIQLCCAFVGASVVTNVNTQEVRLIDFGHPIFFNAANLQYLVSSNKDVGKPQYKEEDAKYRQLFSIFMNFAYGALSYYFMLTMYLGLFNNTSTDSNSNKTKFKQLIKKSN
jgi:hypothetical protein